MGVSNSAPVHIKDNIVMFLPGHTTAYQKDYLVAVRNSTDNKAPAITVRIRGAYANEFDKVVPAFNLEDGTFTLMEHPQGYKLALDKKSSTHLVKVAGRTALAMAEFVDKHYGFPAGTVLYLDELVSYEAGEHLTLKMKGA